MCLYSVEADQTRPAQEGDRLVVHAFDHATGLTEADRPGQLACCMTTGMTARFDAIPQGMQNQFGLPAQATAVFEQGKPGTYDDCFVFKGTDGGEVRIPLEFMPEGLETVIVPVVDEVDQAANETMDRIMANVAAGDTSDTHDDGRELVAAGTGRSRSRARSAALVAIFMIIILA